MQSLRRHHRERLKHNRRAYYGRPLDDKELSMAVSTPKRTQGCVCCTNPRRFGHDTIQELKADQELADFQATAYCPCGAWAEESGLCQTCEDRDCDVLESDFNDSVVEWWD